MSSKEASGVKKDKSFNGSKAKYSPNPPVPDKKEVKLRRKESEKLKQANSDTSTRKSVLGRIFRSFVDSDDSRKTNASADAKKKKGARDAGENFGSDLDLPEHGIFMRRVQAREKNQEVLPSARLRASTLSAQGQQGRDNRNRWSSYDIHGSNFMEGFLPPFAKQLDALTLGHRSQSDETLNTPLATDQNIPRLTGNFENAKHSTNATRQPDVMRRHAVLLKTIQEKSVSKGTRSELQGGQSGNVWLQSGDTVPPNGQRNNLDASEVKDANLKLHVPKSLDSGAAVTADAGKKSGSENSVSFVLLQEKNKEIEKALADKRRILSNLFKTPEEDMQCLIQRDVELSEDLTVRKMILISLLQSDQLTSVISDSLILQRKVSTADKEVFSQKGVKSDTEQKDNPLHFRSLQSTTMRLYQNVKLLTAMFSKEVAERDCVKKELEETQNRLKKKITDQSLLETKQTEEHNTNVIRQRVDDANLELKTPTEIHDLDTEQLNREQELKLDVADTFIMAESEPVNDSVAISESVTVEIGSKIDSVNAAVQRNSEDDGTEVKQLLTSSDDFERKKCPLHDDDPALLEPYVENLVDMNVCVHLDSDKEAENSVSDSGNQEDSVSFLKTESVNLFSAVQDANQFDSEAYKTNNITTIPILKISDSDFQFQQGSFCDFTHDIQDEGAINVSQSHDDWKFQNLESIQEDDDKLSACDAKHGVVFDDNSKEMICSNVQISVEHSVYNDGNLCLDAENDTQPNAEDDSLSNVKIDVNSEQNVVSQSVMKSDASFCVKGDTDESTLEVGVQSNVDSAICGLEEHSNSGFDYVLPMVQITSDEDSSITDQTPVLYKTAEQKSPHLSDDHIASFDVNDVEQSVNPPRIAVDEEEEEE